MQNARVVICEKDQKAAIIDPGADAERLLALAEPDTFKIDAIILTHCHIDHGGAVKKLSALIKETQGHHPTLYYHSADKILGQNIEPYAVSCGLDPSAYQNVPDADRWTDDLDTISIGTIDAQIRFTPGHAPGHIVLYFEQPITTVLGDYPIGETTKPVLIAGDTLFRESIGRTDLPMGNHDELLSSIRTKLFTLPDDTLVLPGHGPNTTIKHEKSFNPFLGPSQ